MNNHSFLRGTLDISTLPVTFLLPPFRLSLMFLGFFSLLPLRSPRIIPPNSAILLVNCWRPSLVCSNSDHFFKASTSFSHLHRFPPLRCLLRAANSCSPLGFVLSPIFFISRGREVPPRPGCVLAGADLGPPGGCIASLGPGVSFLCTNTALFTTRKNFMNPKNRRIVNKRNGILGIIW